MGFITNITAAVPTTGMYVDGFPSGVDNDQGNIRAGGTIAETLLWTSSSLGEEDRYVLLSSGVNNTGVIGPSVLSTFNNQPGQVIVKYTTEIAGVDDLSMMIRAASSSGVKSINQLAVMESIDYKTSVVAGNWNIFSGAFTPALSVTEAGAWNVIGGVDQSSDMIGNQTDKAANPTPAAPGHLAYMAGNLGLPTTGTYSARTIW